MTSSAIVAARRRFATSRWCSPRGQETARSTCGDGPRRVADRCASVRCPSLLCGRCTLKPTRNPNPRSLALDSSRQRPKARRGRRGRRRGRGDRVQAALQRLDADLEESERRHLRPKTREMERSNKVDLSKIDCKDMITEGMTSLQAFKSSIQLNPGTTGTTMTTTYRRR